MATKHYTNDTNDLGDSSIKKMVYDELDQNSLLTPKKLCKLCGLEYEQYKGYVTLLRHKWKYDIRNELRSKSPKSHRARAQCRAVKSMSRELALRVGWKPSANRNRCIFFVDKVFGRIEWWETGNIIVSVRKPATMARVKRFLYRAVFDTGLIFDGKVMDAFVGKVHWKGAHDVFRTREKLPYTVIDRYEKTHGLRIVLGDLSHRDSVEVQWVRPDWLDELVEMKELNMQYLHDFTRMMKELASPKGMPKSPSGMVV